MELTEHAVARPDDKILFKDFESRQEWYREWLKTAEPEPKRKGFVQVHFFKKPGGVLDMTSELVPPDDIINHCDLLRKYHLDHGSYFKWVGSLEQQLKNAGVTVEIPDYLTNEKLWRLAQNEKHK